MPRISKVDPADFCVNHDFKSDFWNVETQRALGVQVYDEEEIRHLLHRPNGPLCDRAAAVVCTRCMELQTCRSLNVSVAPACGESSEKDGDSRRSLLTINQGFIMRIINHWMVLEKLRPASEKYHELVGLRMADGSVSSILTYHPILNPHDLLRLKAGRVNIVNTSNSLDKPPSSTARSIEDDHDSTNSRIQGASNAKTKTSTLASRTITTAKTSFTTADQDERALLAASARSRSAFGAPLYVTNAMQHKAFSPIMYVPPSARGQSNTPESMFSDDEPLPQRPHSSSNNAILASARASFSPVATPTQAASGFTQTTSEAFAEFAARKRNREEMQRRDLEKRQKLEARERVLLEKMRRKTAEEDAATQGRIEETEAREAEIEKWEAALGHDYL